MPSRQAAGASRPPAGPARATDAPTAAGPARAPDGRTTEADATDRAARLTTRSAAETVALGEQLGRLAQAGDLICLWGDLGAGKTQLAKGIARGLGIDETVNSPTFILMAEYAGRLPLFHVDLYRLSDAADALAGGVIDDRQRDGLTIVEWPDRMRSVLPGARLDVEIDGSGDESREIRLIAHDPRYARYLALVR
jgi:tRNA threonylcarbamoyladenosine biosynthesis protein TsaE